MTIKSFFDDRFSLLDFGWTAFLAGLLRLFGDLLRRFFTPNNSCGISADVSGKLLRKVLLYQRIVYPAAKTAGGKFGEGP